MPDVKEFFPIKGFSQSEIIEFARQPEVRLSLTDDLIDNSQEKANIAETIANLKENAAKTFREQSRKEQICEQTKDRERLVEEISGLDKLLKNPQIVLQRQWYTEQRLLKEIRTRCADVKPKLKTAFSPLVIEVTWPNPPKLLQIENY